MIHKLFFVPLSSVMTHHNYDPLIIGGLNMSHENIKTHFVEKSGKSFVVSLTTNVYKKKVVNISRVYGSTDFIKYRIFEDVNVREFNGKTNKWGKPIPDIYTIDCVLFVEPGQDSLDKREVYSVAVKLLNSEDELIGKEMRDHYMNYTDFFFVGVPSDSAVGIINRKGEDDNIGVFSVNDGRIWFMPERIRPSANKHCDILEQIMFSKMFNEDFKNSISIKVMDQGLYSGTLHTASDAFNEEYDANGYSDIDLEKSQEYKAEARKKEKERQRKHNAKVNTIRQELDIMNAELPVEIMSILDRLSLGDQRIYHVIRKDGGIQAQSIADKLPVFPDVEKPSLATIKRSIKSLTAAGLIERKGSRKTGQYVTKK